MDMVATSPCPLPLSVDHMNQVSTINNSTPFMSAASSPPPTRPPLDIFFYSTPTNPRSHTSCSLIDDCSSEHVALLRHNSCNDSSYCCTSSFDRELNHGVAKTSDNLDQFYQEFTRMKEEKAEDFQFDFSGQLDMMVKPCLSSADELFDGGQIRPLKLKPPPSLQINHDNDKISAYYQSPKSPKSTMSKFKDALSLSPKHRRYVSDLGPENDPFEAAILDTRKSHFHSCSPEREWKWDCNDNAAANAGKDEVKDRGRGRDRGKAIKAGDTNMNMNKRGGNNSRAGTSRSLSPLRVSEFALLQHQDQQNFDEPSNSTSIFGRGSSNSYFRKWRLKDLFLFRSASEGHYKDTQSFSKRWSFRSPSMASGSESGSGSGSGSKRRVQTSTHEMIYTKNRAISEELKKKTMLPYKHGLLACLGFNPVPQFSYAFSNTP